MCHSFTLLSVRVYLHIRSSVARTLSLRLAQSLTSNSPSVVTLDVHHATLFALQDRAFRDDERCRAKYGKYWAKYSTLVPYKMIPYVW